MPALCASLIERMHTLRQADLGGTNLLDPLDYVADEPQKPEYPRFVFVVTDGDVTNREEVLAFVKRHADAMRVVCVATHAQCAAVRVCDLTASNL